MFSDPPQRTIPSLCPVLCFRRAEQQERQNTCLGSTIFGQINIDMLIKCKRAFSKKLKLSLNNYTRVYEASLLFLRRERKEARRRGELNRECT